MWWGTQKTHQKIYQPNVDIRKKIKIHQSKVELQERINVRERERE